MKTYLYSKFKKAYFIVLILLPSIVAAQDTLRPITKFLDRRGYTYPGALKKSNNSQWPDTLYYNTAYKPPLLGSLTVPISFSDIERVNGNYKVNPTVSVGLGYTWFVGDFILSEDDKITVDPKYFFGVIGNIGLENKDSTFSLTNLGSFSIDGFVGVGAFTLFFGYDIINKAPSLGIGGRIDLYTLSNRFLHILGKVKEVRKHRKIAPPITRY